MARGRAHHRGYWRGDRCFCCSRLATPNPVRVDGLEEATTGVTDATVGANLFQGSIVWGGAVARGSADMLVSTVFRDASIDDLVRVLRT
jgi:hypothetical protein